MRVCLGCGAGFLSGEWRCPQCGYSPPQAAGFLAFAPEIAGGGAGFDPAHFAEFARLEAGNFWFRARNRLIVWAIAQYFGQARNFLEVGCGTGYVLSGIAAAFPGMKLAGSEAATEGLAFAVKRLPGANLMQMDARRIPFRAEFEVVGAFDVIEHIEEDAAVLRALHEAVVPGGGLLLTVPQHPFLWSEYDARARHVRRYRAQELREKVAAAGFEVIKMTSFVSLLLPLMAASRLKQRRIHEDYDPLAELKIAPWLNRALEKVLDFERALIRAGIDFPAGGSLLLVARRPL
ncbi:MAG: class I SAM-dependent methyltransferase [Betaproteobacteria bacterium]|nr:class I SAM-dependent methyltransferase [Betaproteobacteria bacterium]